jgi:hypothetical protein
MEFISPKAHEAGLNGGMFKNVEGEFKDGVLTVKSYNGYVMDRLENGETAKRFAELVREFFGQGTTIEYKRTQDTQKSRADLEREAKEHPLILEAVEELNAGILGVDLVRPVKK